MAYRIFLEDEALEHLRGLSAGQRVRVWVYYAVLEDVALVVVTKIGIKDRDRVIIGGESFEL